MQHPSFKLFHLGLLSIFAGIAMWSMSYLIIGSMILGTEIVRVSKEN